MNWKDKLNYYPSTAIEQSRQHFQSALKLLGFPEKSLPAIIVTGTNGKGTVCNKIAAAFKDRYKVGLFTSPHIIRYEERIQISGKCIPESEFRARIEQIYTLCQLHDLKICFFEFITLIAFTYFCDQQIDFAVLEVGIGGTYDPVNSAEPLLAIITSIGMDHMDRLGGTLDLIAQNKAGVFRKKIPVILGSTAQRAVVLDVANKLECEVFKVMPNELVEQENRAIAKKAIELLAKRFPIEQVSISQALETCAPGRFHQSGLFLFDTAHNVQAFSHLVKRLKKTFPEKRFDLVTGFSKDKDAAGCLETILPLIDHIYCVHAYERMLSLEEMQTLLEKLGHKEYSLEENTKDLIERIQTKKKRVIVCGSFYLLGPIYSSLEISLMSSNI